MISLIRDRVKNRWVLVAFSAFLLCIFIFLQLLLNQTTHFKVFQQQTFSPGEIETSLKHVEKNSTIDIVAEKQILLFLWSQKNFGLFQKRATAFLMVEKDSMIGHLLNQSNILNKSNTEKIANVPSMPEISIQEQLILYVLLHYNTVKTTQIFLAALCLILLILPLLQTVITKKKIEYLKQNFSLSHNKELEFERIVPKTIQSSQPLIDFSDKKPKRIDFVERSTRAEKLRTERNLDDLLLNLPKQEFGGQMTFKSSIDDHFFPELAPNNGFKVVATENFWHPRLLFNLLVGKPLAKTNILFSRTPIIKNNELQNILIEKLNEMGLFFLARTFAPQSFLPGSFAQIPENYVELAKMLDSVDINEKIIGITSNANLTNRASFVVMLAKAMLTPHKKILLVDLDFNNLKLNQFTNEPCIYSIRDFLKDAPPAPEIFVKSLLENVFLLHPGCSDESFLAKMNNEGVWYKVFKFSQTYFDQILVLLPEINQLAHLKIQKEKMLFLFLLTEDPFNCKFEFLDAWIPLKHFDLQKFLPINCRISR